MLTTAELQAHLKDFAFPADMTVTIHDDPFEGPLVRIVYRVKDSYSDDKIDLGISSFLSPNDRQSLEAFQAFMVWRVFRIFGHEAREQVQYRGVPISDPHQAPPV
jgi:hypothetical protein